MHVLWSNKDFFNWFVDKTNRMNIKLFIVGTIIVLNSNGWTQTGNPPASYATNPSEAVTNANFAWYRGGNNPGGQAAFNNILGTRWPSNIYIMTNNTVTSEFTQGGQLTSFSGNSGDGLRIRNLTPLGSGGNLDMFTSNNNGQNETHIVWGSNGQISGQNNRFEELARSQGFWFNTLDASGVYKFARSGAVTAIVGTNNFWRIGMQTDAFPTIDGARRLEVVDDKIQFRLHYGGINSVGGPFTDFLSNNAGNLQIMPQNGRVGINLNTNPTANLDVNGNARIRDVQQATPDALIVGVKADPTNPNDMNIRRLDFSGSAGDVLLGDGTWGAAPNPTPTYTGSNGVTLNGGTDFRLGKQYGSPFPVAPFQTNRELESNGLNLILSGTGSFGIGLG